MPEVLHCGAGIIAGCFYLRQKISFPTLHTHPNLGDDFGQIRCVLYVKKYGIHLIIQGVRSIYERYYIKRYLQQLETELDDLTGPFLCFYVKAHTRSLQQKQESEPDFMSQFLFFYLTLLIYVHGNIMYEHIVILFCIFPSLPFSCLSGSDCVLHNICLTLQGKELAFLTHSVASITILTAAKQITAPSHCARIVFTCSDVRCKIIFL